MIFLLYALWFYLTERKDYKRIMEGEHVKGIGRVYFWYNFCLQGALVFSIFELFLEAVIYYCFFRGEYNVLV